MRDAVFWNNRTVSKAEDLGNSKDISEGFFLLFCLLLNSIPHQKLRTKSANHCLGFARQGFGSGGEGVGNQTFGIKTEDRFYFIFSFLFLKKKKKMMQHKDWGYLQAFQMPFSLTPLPCKKKNSRKSKTKEVQPISQIHRYYKLTWNSCAQYGRYW